jgi:hypothetical protein
MIETAPPAPSKVVHSQIEQANLVQMLDMVLNYGAKQAFELYHEGYVGNSAGIPGQAIPPLRYLQPNRGPRRTPEPMYYCLKNDEARYLHAYSNCPYVFAQGDIARAKTSPSIRFGRGGRSSRKSRCSRNSR